MTNYQRTQAFCDAHVNNGGCPEFTEALRRIPETTIVHVRPDENGYDASYWLQNRLAFERDTW